MSIEEDTTFDPNIIEVPLYRTDGGGFATFTNGEYRWYEGAVPLELVADGVQAGDLIPKEWIGLPANDAARAVEVQEFFYLGDDLEGWAEEE